MHRRLLEILVDPVSKRIVQLESDVCENGEVVPDKLRNDSGLRYPITNGIPRFANAQDANRRQTELSFGFKWHQSESYDSEAFRSTLQQKT